MRQQQDPKVNSTMQQLREVINSLNAFEPASVSVTQAASVPDSLQMQQMFM